jgi:hypothetical protein
MRNSTRAPKPCIGKPSGGYRHAVGRAYQHSDRPNKLGRALLRQKRYREAEEESLAGYRILGKQASPSVSWMKNARKDLTEIYTELGETARAQAIKNEEASNGAPTPVR